MKPEDILKEGIKILDPFMNTNGFVFTFIKYGNSSGGNYAFGKYNREDRTIELHYRYSLGLVSYSIGSKHLSHDNYIKLLGVYGKNHYPGFSDNPFQAFEDLLYDFKNFTKDFITGEGIEFIKLTTKFEQNPGMFDRFKWLKQIESNY